MSDTTTLLHEYELSRQLADKMNQTSLTMKRSQRRPVPVQEVTEARHRAATALDAVLRLLRADVTSPDSKDLNTEVPLELIEELRERHGPRMPYLMKDFAEAVKTLQDGRISAEVIEAVDMLSQSADSVASASFRRLRRR
jgi:uncharacterized protein (DUF2267 family)